MYCKKCGIEVEEGKILCENCEQTQKQSRSMQYLSIVLSTLGAVLPFFSWLRVPVAEGLYSLLGMQSETPSFSLFGYIFAGSQYQNETTYKITMVIALVALIGIIFNIIYIIKAFKNKPKCNKYGTIGSIITMIMAFLFIVIVGIMATILKLFKITATPYITLVVSIANIVVLKKIKKAGKVI